MNASQMEELSIGPTPTGEDCQQVGTESYNDRVARHECNVFRRQLNRVFGDTPAGARLTITRHPHEFGSYHDVVVRYDPDNEDATEWAFKLESETPEFWDDEARVELTTFEKLTVV